MYWGVDTCLRTFFALALGKGEGLASRSGRFIYLHIVPLGSAVWVLWTKEKSLFPETIAWLSSFYSSSPYHIHYLHVKSNPRLSQGYLKKQRTCEEFKLELRKTESEMYEIPKRSFGDNTTDFRGIFLILTWGNFG